MQQQELDALVERFNGTPGVTKGLTHDETLAMLQALIDNGQIHSDSGLAAYAEVFQAEGWVKGYTPR